MGVGGQWRTLAASNFLTKNKAYESIVPYYNTQSLLFYISGNFLSNVSKHYSKFTIDSLIIQNKFLTKKALTWNCWGLGKFFLCYKDSDLHRDDCCFISQPHLHYNLSCISKFFFKFLHTWTWWSAWLVNQTKTKLCCSSSPVYTVQQFCGSIQITYCQSFVLDNEYTQFCNSVMHSYIMFTEQSPLWNIPSSLWWA